MRNDIGVPPIPPRDEPAGDRPGDLPHAGDQVVNGKPRVSHPPVNADVANDTPRAHIDPTEPGRHHARFVGEKPKTDVIYAMPMEDRGSTFSITLSVVVITVFTIGVIIVWWSIF